MPNPVIDSLRGMRRSPLASALAILSIGLSVGASALVFSWLESTVLDPWPAVTDAARLVALNQRAPDGGEWSVSWPVFRDWAETGTFDGVAAWTGLRLSRRATAGPPRDVWTMLVSASYFEVLGIRLTAGRSFSADDEATERPVVILAWTYWQREFGGSTDILGSTMDLNGRELTIIGVAPRGFVGTYTGAGFDAWVPVTLQPLLLGENSLRDRQARWLQVLARLRPGATGESVVAGFDATARERSRAAGDVPVTGSLIQPLRMQFIGALVFPLFVAMLAVTSLIVLIACANVAGIQLERSMAKRVELGVRCALGAGRVRLIGAALVDGVLIAVPGFLIATGLTWWLRDTLVALIPPVPLRVELPIAIDIRILALTALAVSGATLIFTIVPAMRAAATDPAEVLREARSGPRNGRIGSGIAVFQLALTMMAVTCAMLFVQSIRRARRLDLGFTGPASLYLAGTEIPSDHGITRLQQLIEAVRTKPGVSAVSVTTMVPLGFGGHRYADVVPEGFIASAEDNVSAERVVVGAGYFRVMGTRLIAGRDFAEMDRPGSEPVAVVNQSFAQRFWPDGVALGRKVTQAGRTGRVVGVTADGRYRDLDDADYPVVYWPISQVWEPRFTMVVRSPAPPWDIVRAAFAEAGQDLPLLAPRTLAEHMRAATFVQEAGASVLGVFASLALVMAMIGLFATLAHRVSNRIREFGVRLALGAGPGDIVLLVLGGMVRLWSLGLLAGVPLAVGTALLLRSQLVGTTPVDPGALLTGASVLTVASLLATIGPSLRAAGIHPATVLNR
jgi:putative ABC transport system permease protein